MLQTVISLAISTPPSLQPQVYMYLHKQTKQKTNQVERTGFEDHSPVQLSY